MCLLLFIIHIKVIGSCIRNQWCRPTIANNNCMEKVVGRLKKGSISTLFWMLKKTSNMPWYVNKTTWSLVLGGGIGPIRPKGCSFHVQTKKQQLILYPDISYTLPPIIIEVEHGALKDEFTVVSKGSVFQVHDIIASVVITCLLDYSRCLGQEPTMIFVAILDLPFRPSASHLCSFLRFLSKISAICKPWTSTHILYFHLPSYSHISSSDFELI